MGSAPRDDSFGAAFELLAEATAAAVIVAGPDGSVRYANQPAMSLLAAPALESITFPAAVLARLRRDSGPWEEETSIEARGLRTPVRISARPVAAGDSAPGTLMVIHELTDLSTAIAERDLARRNDRAKTRSLHMVAHDMSAPITVLNGYISMVLDGSISLEQLGPYLPMLGDQLAHIQRLVNALLDTARLEEGRLELRLRPLDLSSFVETLVGEMRPPETRHRLVVRAAPAKLPVLADAIRLDSIIRNVVSNAIKYSPEGTTVTCTTWLDGGSAALEVADEGNGIDAADLDRLFTRFGRVGDLTANPAGIGLGLFVSRELARLHGGDLVAASDPGRGSRFTLRLPLREAGRG